MKKFVAILIIMLNGATALAFEDYLIVSDFAIDKIVCEKNNIIEVNPIFTIENDKKFITLKAKSKGSAAFYVLQQNKKTEFKVRVDESSTTISPNEGFEYIILDKAPEQFKLDLPPTLKGGE